MGGTPTSFPHRRKAQHPTGLLQSRLHRRRESGRSICGTIENFNMFLDISFGDGTISKLYWRRTRQYTVHQKPANRGCSEHQCQMLKMAPVTRYHRDIVSRCCDVSPGIRSSFECDTFYYLRR
jgi:hypothetical protein